ncbi:MAG: glycosyltransferase family 2 protein [Eubacteriales bacterium]
MCETLYLVIPCFNEEEVLPETSRRLDLKIRDMIEKKIISEKSKIFFVDDGSKDNTWEIIKQLHSENELFSGLTLAHNSGEQNAYIAGMMAVKDYADMVITMDADLQDDINAIDKMVNEYYAGNDIVYGVRSSRKKDSFFKKFTARAFYKVMKTLGTELIPDHSQYRLMSRRAIEALLGYSEVNLFLPALIPLLGFNNSIVYHERKERFAGESKYSFWKLLLIFNEAITSFSVKPIHFITGTGFLFLFVSLCISIYLLIRAIAGEAVGWILILASVWAVGGMILLAIGIVGEYIGKTYSEAKQRPRYIISESFLDELE